MNPTQTTAAIYAARAQTYWQLWRSLVPQANARFAAACGQTGATSNDIQGKE